MEKGVLQLHRQKEQMGLRYPPPERWSLLLQKSGDIASDKSLSTRHPPSLLSSSELFEHMALYGEELGPRQLCQLSQSLDSSMLMILCCDSLRDALLRLQAYNRLVLGQELYFEETDDYLELSFEWSDIPHSPPASLTWWELAWLLQVVRLHAGPDTTPLLVGNTQADQCPSHYLDFFKLRPVSRPLPTLRLSKSHAGCSLPKASLQDFIAYYSHLPRDTHENQGWSKEVRNCLLRQLPGGRTRIQDVCFALKKSRRSLQRLLKREQTSFRSLLTQTRKELSQYYLHHKGLHVIEVTFLLGYDDIRSFTRASKSWTTSTEKCS